MPAIRRELRASDGLTASTGQREHALKLARALNATGDGLLRAGRKEEALTMTREAVATARASLPAHGARRLLAELLVGHGAVLAMNDRFEDALTVLDEAVGALRPLAEMAPGHYLLTYAMTLRNLATTQADLRRHSDTVRTAQLLRDEFERIAPSTRPRLWSRVDAVFLAERLVEAGEPDRGRRVGDDAVAFAERAFGAVPEELARRHAALRRTPRRSRDAR